MCAYVLRKEASKLMSEVCLNPPFRSQPSFLTEFFVPDFYWGAPSAEQLIQELSFAPGFAKGPAGSVAAPSRPLQMHPPISVPPGLLFSCSLDKSIHAKVTTH